MKGNALWLGRVGLKGAIEKQEIRVGATLFPDIR